MPVAWGIAAATVSKGNRQKRKRKKKWEKRRISPIAIGSRAVKNLLYVGRTCDTCDFPVGYHRYVIKYKVRFSLTDRLTSHSNRIDGHHVDGQVESCAAIECKLSSSTKCRMICEYILWVLLDVPSSMSLWSKLTSDENFRCLYAVPPSLPQFEAVIDPSTGI